VRNFPRHDIALFLLALQKGIAAHSVFERLRDAARRW